MILKPAAPLVEVLGQWDGRLIKRSNRGRGQQDSAPVKFLGTGVGARSYAVTFSDGVEQRLTHGAVESLLLPQSGPVIAAMIPASTPQQLPPKWLLDSYEHVRRCLTTLAPGHWTEGHITGILMQASMFATEPADSYQPADLLSCVSYLSSQVTLPMSVTNLWPYGSSGLRDALCGVGVDLKYDSNDPIAALFPAFYAGVLGGVQTSVFVGCPSGHVCDLILFLGALFAPAMLAVLVPATYHTHAPSARSAALGRIARADRACVLPCPNASDIQLTQSVWILVFRNAATKAQMLSSTAMIFDLAGVA